MRGEIDQISTNTFRYIMCCAPNVYMFVYILIGAHIVPLKEPHMTSMLKGAIQVFFFFFLSGGKCRDLARVTKNHHYVVHGPYFDPMTPSFLGVLKSQSRTSTHPGSIPGRVPTVLPLLFGVCTYSTPS